MNFLHSSFSESTTWTFADASSTAQAEQQTFDYAAHVHLLVSGAGSSKPDAVLSPQPPSHDPSVSTGPLRGAAVVSLESKASGQDSAADSPAQPAPKAAGTLLKAKPQAPPAKTGDPVRSIPHAAIENNMRGHPHESL